VPFLKDLPFVAAKDAPEVRVAVGGKEIDRLAAEAAEHCISAPRLFVRSGQEAAVQIGREVAQGNMSSQRPSAAPKEVTVQPAATVVKVDKDGKGSIDVQITRTTTDAFTVTIQGVTVTTPAPDANVLRPASSDDKLKIVKYDLRGTGKITISFTAAKETSSFDLIVGDATRQVAHKVIQIEHPKE
jgi:hypothetical protein